MLDLIPLRKIKVSGHYFNLVPIHVTAYTFHFITYNAVYYLRSIAVRKNIY